MKSDYDRLNENLRFQKELLCHFLNDQNTYFKVFEFVRPEMFTGENRQLFNAFIKLITDKKEIDIINVSEQANIPLEIVTKTFTHFSGVQMPVMGLIHELFDYMAKGKLLNLAAFISSNITAGTDYELIIDQVNHITNDLTLGETASTITMMEAVTELLHQIENNRKNEYELNGIRTGLKIIDNHMGGLHTGDLVVLAGETSHGKTSFALSCMYGSATRYNIPVGIISHEMTPQQLTGRLCAYATEISSKHLLFGKLSDWEFKEFNLKINDLIKSNIFIQNFIKRELLDTVAAIRLMVLQHHVKYVVVENAGNINVKGKYDDESRTAEISKTMKALAIELKITVILISHLSRERDGKKVQPSLNRLRHSGQLENDADVVLFVYRAELHGFETFQDSSDEAGISTTGRVKVYIAKGRNVGLAQTYMYFDEQLTLFSDDNRTAPNF